MYNAFITRIKNVKKHPNADRLQIGECLGSQVIVNLSIKDNDLGAYFPVDGKLSEEFAKAVGLLKIKKEDGTYTSGYLDPKRRNIRALRLRGEMSDGLFLPLAELDTFVSTDGITEGMAFNSLNGIKLCEKYIPVELDSEGAGATEGIGKDDGKKKPKSSVVIRYPDFHTHVDTEQLMQQINRLSIREGETVYITEKLHGTSQRSGFLDNEIVYYNRPWYRRFLKYFFKIPPKTIVSSGHICGTRRNNITEQYNGYLGKEQFRRDWDKKVQQGLHYGEVIYYEVVGYTDTGKALMGNYSTRELSPEEKSLYGDKVVFHYGCDMKDLNDIYVYRMCRINDDHSVLEYPTAVVRQRCNEMGLKFVPILDKFLFTTKEELIARATALCKGLTTTTCDKLNPIRCEEKGGKYYYKGKFNLYTSKLVLEPHNLYTGFEDQLYYVYQGKAYPNLLTRSQAEMAVLEFETPAILNDEARNRLVDARFRKLGENIYINISDMGVTPSAFRNATASTCYPVHPREGVVIRLDDRKSFCAYKHKNDTFKILESSFKNTATEPDIEEAQEICS